MPETIDALDGGTRLVHIGLPKTGSTALQYAAKKLKWELRSEGVNYPGKAENHHRSLSWLAGLKIDYLPDPTPKEQWWRVIEQELDRFSEQRALLSFEMVCTADAEGARRTVDEVGAQGKHPVHVVLVLRNLGSFVPSYWQESLKRGNTRSLEEYLREALADPAAVTASGAFHRRDGLSLLERWVNAVGAENVTVIVLEKDQPTRLLDTFEGLLALPGGLLHSRQLDGAGQNRGMSAAEAALVLRLNRQIRGRWRAPRADHRALVFKGMVNRMLSLRTPSESEGKLVVPHWAADTLVEAGALLADNVRATGVRVVGDLAELERRVPSTDDDATPPAEIPFDLAVEALLGMYSRATGWDAKHKKKVAAGTTVEQLTGQLADARDEVARLTAEVERLRGSGHRMGAPRWGLRSPR
ncbi:hypothetical protein [Myceligenerans xiligouense]|uniref:Sulfotransferase family protein n=1 Tax=Myceligenerans xiligouense TaxID=253184 RepID=A0A3N4YL09_9MICO|nr:hypothetical protein [Myceligenerans xiligouense]RPF20116.1 hypothetical protein EDD34_0694 [Myceligenerans xiligouense]